MIPRPGYDLDVNPVEPDYSADEVADLLSQGEPAIKVPGLQRLVQRREPYLLSTASLDPASEDPAAIALLCDKDIITRTRWWNWPIRRASCNC
jgi:50S ribosomal protein L16 3-hydroxylase